MPRPATHLAVPHAVRTLLACLLTAVLALPLASASSAAAATGTVRGEVIGADGRFPLKVMWFTKDWRYLGQRRVHGDIYTLGLAAGRYHLQFVDLRPARKVDKFAPTDVTVTVRAGRAVQHDVRLHRGAVISGTVLAGGKPAAHATVVAANTAQQSFTTRADKKGRYAVGGLPPGSYSVFVYDRARQWVAKSAWVPDLGLGDAAGARIDLRTRAGSLLVDLLKPDGTAMTGSFPVTAVSRSSGQFWTARAHGGTVTFQGLYPGRYRLVAPGVGNYLAHSGPVRDARVRSGHADLASSFRWTRRGGSVVGYVVDAEDPTYPLSHAQVILFDRYGTELDRTWSDGDGRFWLGGQLLTQDGLTVVVNPDPDSGGWMQAAAYCPYAPASAPGVAVRTGEVTDAGNVLLPHDASVAGVPAACLPGGTGGG